MLLKYCLTAVYYLPIGWFSLIDAVYVALANVGPASFTAVTLTYIGTMVDLAGAPPSDTVTVSVNGVSGEAS